MLGWSLGFTAIAAGAIKIRDGVKRNAARKKTDLGYYASRRAAAAAAQPAGAPRTMTSGDDARPPAPGTTLTGVSPIRRRSGGRTPSRGRRRRGTRPSAAITRRSGTPRMGGPGARAGARARAGAGAGLARRYWRGLASQRRSGGGAPRDPRPSAGSRAIGAKSSLACPPVSSSDRG